MVTENMDINKIKAASSVERALAPLRTPGREAVGVRRGRRVFDAGGRMRRNPDSLRLLPEKLDITSCVRRVALENTDRLCMMSLYILCTPHRVNFMSIG